MLDILQMYFNVCKCVFQFQWRLPRRLLQVQLPMLLHRANNWCIITRAVLWEVMGPRPASHYAARPEHSMKTSAVTIQLSLAKATICYNVQHSDRQNWSPKTAAGDTLGWNRLMYKTRCVTQASYRNDYHFSLTAFMLHRINQINCFELYLSATTQFTLCWKIITYDD